MVTTNTAVIGEALAGDQRPSVAEIMNTPVRTRRGPALVPPEDPAFHFVSFFDLQTKRQGFYELSNDQSAHRPQLVREIAGWQFEDIDKVYEAADGSFTDITADIAHQVLVVAVDDSEINWSLCEWLQNVLGCRLVEEVLAANGVEVA